MALIIFKKKGETKDDMIGKFRRIYLEEDITEEIKKRTAYQKPSEIRYEKKKLNIWRKKCRRRSKNSRLHVTSRSA